MVVFATTSITQTALCAGTSALECTFSPFGGDSHLGLEILRIAGPVLLAGAGLVLVFTQPWRWWVRLLAAAPSVLTLVNLVRSMQPPMFIESGVDSVSMMMMGLGFSAGIEVGAAVALLAILTTSTRGIALSRVILLLVASTGTGYLHALIGGEIAEALGARPAPESVTEGFVSAASIAIPTLVSIALRFAQRRCGDEQPSPAVLTAPRAGGFLLTELLLIAASGVVVWPPAETPAAVGITVLLMDVAGFVGAIVLLTPSPTSLSAGNGIRVILVALAVTAPSLGHLLTDYMVMIGFSEANWDAPPGTGYLTAFSIALFALLSMIVGLIARLWTNLRPSQLLQQPAPVG